MYIYIYIYTHIHITPDCPPPPPGGLPHRPGGGGERPAPADSARGRVGKGRDLSPHLGEWQLPAPFPFERSIPILGNLGQRRVADAPSSWGWPNGSAGAALLVDLSACRAKP